MKATTKNLEGIFKVFCDSYGYRVAKNRLDEGALALWDNGTNSWSIARMLDNYGITMPFGHETYTKKELAESWINGNLSHVFSELNYDFDLIFDVSVQLDTQNKINFLTFCVQQLINKPYKSENEISHTVNISHIKALNTKLSKAQAKEVLNHLNNNIDDEFGLTDTTIKCAIEELFDL